MQILHFEFKLIQDNYVELRYFENNPNQYQSRSLPLQDIGDLIKLAERDYYDILPKDRTKTETRLFEQINNPSQLAKRNYNILPEDYKNIGIKLFNWLDGDDRFLEQLLNKHRRQGIILAFSTSENIANLPWELLQSTR